MWVRRWDFAIQRRNPQEYLKVIIYEYYGTWANVTKMLVKIFQVRRTLTTSLIALKSAIINVLKSNYGS